LVFCAKEGGNSLHPEKGVMTEIRIVLVGVGGVGKSATAIIYVTGQFVADYDPTIEDSHRKQVNIDGLTQMLDILDTAGQEEFTSMQDEWFRSGEGFLLMYSLTDRRSLDEAVRLRDKVLRIKNKPKVGMVFCGNKADLEHERQVPIEDGRNLAAKWGCPFFETSAKNHSNITETFEALVREVRQLRKVAGFPGLNRQRGLAAGLGKKRCVLF